MSGISERHRAVEGQLRHDDELRFKVSVRRNRALGRWAAAKLGIPDAELDAYVKAVVESDFEAPGNLDVIGKVKGDLDAAGIKTSEVEIETKLVEFTEEAIEDVKQHG